MFSPRSALRGFCRHKLPPKITLSGRRHLLTLAIESSCDDTSVAIVEKHGGPSASPTRSSLHFLENITADSREYGGIHPIVAQDSHEENMAKLVSKALRHLPPAEFTSVEDVDRIIALPSTTGRTAHDLRRKPDFISVTRGPGMRSNLSIGLDTAKGLSVAYQIPLVGVHHMQAHLLTPRLAASLQAEHSEAGTALNYPDFPFMSILVSGGHSLLVHSKSIVDHEILASTYDIAIGDALDKIARVLLPESYLQQSKTTMYGKMLESFAFPNGPSDYADYRPRATRGEEVVKLKNDQWGWSFALPFAETKKMEFSFAGVASRTHKLVRDKKQKWEAEGKTGDGFMSDDERVALARAAMTICFEHLASRTLIGLDAPGQQPGHKNELADINYLVISGGVGANQFLRKVLRSSLDIRGYSHVGIVAPPPYLCTDNAAMIGWAGIEMFEAGWRSDLGCRALRKWTLDARADDGGILGPEDWIKFN
ncbi:hypothetical protein FQN50_008140 [Emmonsiellopsis sp. PD_5]|nr:hypothetical protein FQN50_008140 [Emmonsiellopsis sp. PD_5]